MAPFMDAPIILNVNIRGNECATRTDEITLNTKNPSISLPYSDFFVSLQWKNLKLKEYEKNCFAAMHTSLFYICVCSK